MPHQKPGLHTHGKTGGFTNSASLNGDKQVSLICMQTLASCMWGLGKFGLPPSNTFSSTRNDINHLGGSVRLLVTSPSDRPADDIPLGDLETAKQYGTRVADIANVYTDKKQNKYMRVITTVINMVGFG